MYTENFSHLNEIDEIDELDAQAETMMGRLNAEIEANKKSYKSETIFSAKGAALTLRLLKGTASAKYCVDSRVNFDDSNYADLAQDAYIIIFTRWMDKGRTSIPSKSYMEKAIEQAAKKKNLVISDWGMKSEDKFTGLTGCRCGCNGEWSEAIWQVRTMLGGGKYRWSARIEGQPVPSGAWQRALCPACMHQLQTSELSHVEDLECSKISTEVYGDDGEVAYSLEGVVLHPEYDSNEHHADADAKKVATEKAKKAAKRARYIRMGGDIIKKYCAVIFDGGSAKDAAGQIGISEQALSLKVIYWRNQCSILETGKPLPPSDIILERNTAKLQTPEQGCLFADWFPATTEAKAPARKRTPTKGQARPTGPKGPAFPQASF